MDVLLLMLGMAWGAEKLGTRRAASVVLGVGVSICTLLAGLLVYALFAGQSWASW